MESIGTSTTQDGITTYQSAFLTGTVQKHGPCALIFIRFDLIVMLQKKASICVLDVLENLMLESIILDNAL